MPVNLTDYLRIGVYAALVAVVLALFQAWDRDHPTPEVQQSPSAMQQGSIDNTAAGTSVMMQTSSLAQISASSGTKTLQGLQTNQSSPSSTPLTTASLSLKPITVTTDLVQAVIDPRGGNLISLSLLKYPAKLHSKDPTLLLNDTSEKRYIAESGLFSKDGPDTSEQSALYRADQTAYTLKDGDAVVEVKLHTQSTNGIAFTKIYTFHRHSYEIDVNYQIDNASQKAWSGNLYLQLLRKNTPPETEHGVISFGTYFGAAISSPEKKYEKISFTQMQKMQLDRVIRGGWFAMVQHYFVSAFVPEPNTEVRYFSRVMPNGLYAIGTFGPTLIANPGEKITTSAKFYAGPAIAKNLEAVAPGLQLTIDYGWLWMISVAIFWLMQKIYNVVGNWGWSIVLVTLIIKLAFYHLSAKSYRSMSALKKLQPRINALKEQYGDDKQKLTQATLELYRKEKVNPMSGCLPILIQIPVFIALYWVLIESVQLRQAPFIFWIHDLSKSDPTYILPILMGLSMFLQQRLNPPPPDPTQAKLMLFMPVIFTVMFAKFPSGLVLYWFINNTVSFLQQWYIMRSMDKPSNTNKKEPSKKLKLLKNN